MDTGKPAKPISSPVMLYAMAREVRELTTAKGWRDGNTTFAEYIALAHSELSEALEGWRDRDLDNVAEELADTLIRLIDMADVFNIDLCRAYRAKMEKGWQRPYQHGGRTLGGPPADSIKVGRNA